MPEISYHSSRHAGEPIWNFAQFFAAPQPQPARHALQQPRQAYERTTTRLEAAYLAAKATWVQLAADWQALRQPRTAAATPAVAVP